jgi:hypothetical protein
MKLSSSHLSMVAALSCSLLTACGGNAAGTDPVANGAGGAGGGSGGPADTCDPKAAIPCFKGLAEPCKNFHTKFDGDEYCLEPPDPSVGMQMHVGPTDYDDPVQTDKYVMPPGAEPNWYENVTLSNTTTKYTRGYHSSMRPGSHHFIMYAIPTPANGPTGPVQTGGGVESASGVGGRFLAGATRATQDIDTNGTFPEDQGIGSEMPPLQTVSANLHYINQTDHPLLQELWMNFIFIDEALVTQFVKPITWYGGLAMNIKPGTHVTLHNNPTSCKAPADIRVAMMTAHAHASTLRVTTNMIPAAGGGPTQLFSDYNWHEPTGWRFDRAATNPTVDAVAGTSGAISGILQVKKGDQFGWECEIQNNQPGNLTFGNHLLTGEMCNVFGFYYTKDRAATPWTCAFQ